MQNRSKRDALEHKWRLGFGSLLLLLLINAGIALFNTQRLIHNTNQVNHTYRVLRTLEAAFSSLQDAETGVRGYIIAGNDAFLEPYYRGMQNIGPELDRLRFLTRDNPQRVKQIATLESQIRLKIETLRSGELIFRREGFAASQRLTRTGRGKRQMDAIRRTVAAIQASEDQLLARRNAESSQSAQGAIGTFWVATLANLALLGAIYLLLMRDMAERKRVEASLREASEVAEAASRSKSEFLSSVSHELRTPLNAVIGFGKLLLNPRVGTLNDDQNAYTHDIVQSAEHLLQLINDILDISKIEAGKMTLDLAPFDLAELLHSSLGIVREKANQENLSLTTDLAPEIGGLAMVVGDRRKIKQVLYNLLSNAVKFTPEGGSVTIRARAAQPGELDSATASQNVATANESVGAIEKISSSNGAATTARRNNFSSRKGGARPSHSDHASSESEQPLPKNASFSIPAPPDIIISVSDTGIGIAPDQQQRVFDAFEQVDNSYSRRQTGTGLGLALTKRMVELHGGKMWLESEEGHGSTFSFSLPPRARATTDKVEDVTSVVAPQSAPRIETEVAV